MPFGADAGALRACIIFRMFFAAMHLRLVAHWSLALFEMSRLPVALSTSSRANTRVLFATAFVVGAYFTLPSHGEIKL